MAFALHPKLAEDCAVIGDLPLCRVLLMNNRLFPWLVLVPMREGVRELFELGEPDFAGVMAEVRRVSERFARHTAAHKMNVAALGNMVPQLHIHIIARFENDPAWPQPVWNSGVKSAPYAAAEIHGIIEELHTII